MLITDLWRHEAGKYFCISTKSGRGTWSDKLFARDELDEVADYIEDHRDKDVYFCPHGFSAKRRVKENAVLPSLLWADMDAVDPRKIELRPTIAIESSPERYVGLWEMDAAVTEELNQRLTYHIGADKSGWDLSQVLRVPGTTNYKYAALPTARVLWTDGPEYRVSLLNMRLVRLPEHDRKRRRSTGTEVAGDVDIEAARELLRDVPALKRKFIRILLAINSGPKIKDKGSPLRSNKSDVWWRQAKMMRNAGASDEEMAALLTLCRRTFAVRFPEGFGRSASCQRNRTALL